MIKYELLEDKMNISNGSIFVSSSAINQLNELSREYDIVSVSHSKYTVGDKILNSILVGYKL